MRTWWLVACALGSSAVASARPSGCPNVDTNAWDKVMDDIDRAFQAEAFARARKLLQATDQQVPCLSDVPMPGMVARFARQQAYINMLDVDRIEATRWAQLAKAVDPEGQWPRYVPPAHEVRRLVVEEGEAPVAGDTEHAVKVPHEGGVFYDGRYLTSLTTEAGIPHLLQVAQGDGEITRAEWIDGATFPEELRAPLGSFVPPPPPWVGKPGGVAQVRRERRLLVAGGFGAAAAGLFLTSWMARSAYDQRPTDGLYYTVNGAAAVSGLSGGAALTMVGAAFVLR